MSGHRLKESRILWSYNQTAKNLPPMWETCVTSLGREDPWRRIKLNTPLFLPVESHRQRSLVGCSPRGHKESDTTERPAHNNNIFGEKLSVINLDFQSLKKSVLINIFSTSYINMLYL